MSIPDVTCNVTNGSELATIINQIKSLAESLPQVYWFVDESTISAVSHVGGATDTYLTNNGLGADTTEYNPNSKDRIWDSSTGKFDLTSLKIGDIVDITGGLLFDNLAAQEVDIFMSVAEGTSTPHEHQLNHNYYKTANTGTGLVFTYHYVVKNSDERTGGARLRFSSPQNASLTVVHWSCTVTEV